MCNKRVEIYQLKNGNSEKVYKTNTFIYKKKRVNDIKKKILFFLILFFCFLTLASAARADTFTVDTNADSGEGSLRQAVLNGNASAASYTVSFSGTIGTITLLSALPGMTQEVIFDLPSAVGTVVLKGNSVSSSQKVTFSSNTASGIFNFDSDSSMFITNQMIIGCDGGQTGALNITNGGAVNNIAGFIGYHFATGAVTVDGANSTWTNSGDLTLGRNSSTLNINNGGAVTSVNGVVDGSVTVDGADSTWTNSSDLTLGGITGQIGALNITNGGAVSNVNSSIEGSSGKTSSVTVDGANSTWTNSGDLTLGYYTTLNITNGGTVSNTTGTIGSYGTSTVTVDGADSTWTNSGDLTINKGALNITNGGAVNNIAGFIGGHYATSTVTVDGANSTWTNSGDLSLGGDHGRGTLNITDNATVNIGGGTGTITLANYPFATGILNIGEGLTAGTLNAATVTGGIATATVNFNHNEAAYTFAPILAGSLSVNHIGTGTTILTGANTYTGTTTIGAGTLSIGTGGTTGSLGTGAVTNNAALLFNRSNDLSVSNAISGTGTLEKDGAGILTLSGANTYSGVTTISAGTLSIGNANALGTGAVVNNAALDIGANTLNVTGVYTQNNNSKLKVTVENASTAGQISSASAAVVSAASTVNVMVTDNIYIPNNTAFKIINGAGGSGVNTPGTITSSNPHVRFLGSSSNGDLILTADRSGIGFSSLAANSNAAAAGDVLDNISTPSGDMTTTLNTLEGLSNSQTASALDTVIPVIDNGVISTSNNALNQFTGTATDRLEGLQAQARNPGTGETGVSTGSQGSEGFEAWGKGFGKYIHQKPRGLSNGYRATIWGTAMGGDIPAFDEKARLGISGGYAQSSVNSKDNSGKTDIDSYSSMLYGGYAEGENPFYLNGSFSFAYNTYESSRQIAIGAIARTADSDYDGQQYSVLIDGGYGFNIKELRVTPIASLQYMRLHLEEYTETGAGALNLNVQSQNYDMLQSGLGMKLERPFKIKSGTIIPEVHAKWLYDFIGDRQETTSAFSGGGGSFITQGFDPAQNSFDIGTKFSLITEGNWSFEVNYNFQYKEDFRAHTGWADARYKF